MEERLGVFVGDWNNIGKVFPGPFGQGGSVTGSSKYHWDLNGKWLLFASQLDLPGIGTYEVRGGVAFNPQSSKYDSFAFNSMGILIAYAGEWETKNRLVFTSTYPQQDTARVVYKISTDGSFKMLSESKSEQEGYQVYFETKFKKKV